MLGAAGAVQFVAWEYLPGTAVFDVMRRIGFCPLTADGHPWQAVDVGYHSPRPMYEEHSPMGSCHLLEGDCFYDGSGLQAEKLLERVMVNGEIVDDLIWVFLEEYYAWRFA